jgi:hypothetical protein
MRRIVVLGVAVSALAIAAAGCGGGGGGSALSKEEYSSKLDKICADLNAKNKEIGEPDSIQGIADKGPELNDAFQDAIDKVEGLDPPDELKDAHEKFLSLGKQIHDKIDELIDEAKKNDQEGLQRVAAEIEPLDTESNTIARNQLGAPACAQSGT